MTSRRLATFAILLFCALTPPAAFAWNETGHLTVALLAWRQLSDGQRQQVSAILKQHPHYALYLNNYVPEGSTPEEWAFLRAATWPDFVRSSRGGAGPEELYKGPEITRYHHGSWHYVERIWVPPAERKKIDPTTLPASTQPSILDALDDNVKQFESPETKPQERAIALAWIEHLVGDIHQPLHACGEATSQYPKGDQGGNLQAIRGPGGYPMNLHSFWDQCLGTSDSYAVVDLLAWDISSEPRLAIDKLPEAKRDTTFESWADESHEYAIGVAYLNGRLRTAPYRDYEDRKINAEDVPGIPPGYAENARILAKRRVALAAYRLAEQIRSMLAK